MSFSSSWPRFYCDSCNTEIKWVFGNLEQGIGFACECTTHWTGLLSIPLNIDWEQIKQAGKIGKEFGAIFSKKKDEDLLKCFGVETIEDEVISKTK